MGNSDLTKGPGSEAGAIPMKALNQPEFLNGIADLEWGAGIDRRRSEDRRKGNMPIFSKYWLTGRRGVFRREEDRKLYRKLDRHNPKTLAIILTIIMLSIMDAIFTLELIHNGAAEVNPIMAYYLNFGPMVFFGAKYILTCASILLIFLNQHAYVLNNRVPMKSLYLFLIIPYVLVVQWEIYLLFSINH